MIARALTMTLVALSLVFGAQPAVAGGMVTVRLVEWSDPVAGEPWTVVVLIQQHDVTPIDISPVTAVFTSTDDSQRFELTLTPTGKTGYYQFEAVFPMPGRWNWEVTAGGFPVFAMATLSVADPSDLGGADSLQVKFVNGNCDRQGAEIQTETLATAETADGTRYGVVLFRAFDEVLARATGDAVAIVVFGGLGTESVKGCAPLPPFDGTTPVVVSIGATAESPPLATLTIVPNANGVEASVMVFARPALDEFIVHIIEGSEGGAFEPALLTIPAGATVRWVNETKSAHTVTGMTTGMESSGLIDPGASYAATFATPGTYDYTCSPHTWMTGAITVMES